MKLASLPSEPKLKYLGAIYGDRLILGSSTLVRNYKQMKTVTENVKVLLSIAPRKPTPNPKSIFKICSF